MMLCNRTSRYHVAEAAVRGGALHNSKVAVVAHELVSYFKHLAQKNKDYIYANGKGEPITSSRHLSSCSPFVQIGPILTMFRSLTKVSKRNLAV
jgi:hypothetical protein